MPESFWTFVPDILVIIVHISVVISVLISLCIK